MFKIGGAGMRAGQPNSFIYAFVKYLFVLLTLFRSFSGHQREYITKIKEFSTKRPLKNG